VITVIPELDYTINTLGTVNQTGAAALCNNDSIQDVVFTVVGGEGAAQVSLTWTTANELENVNVTPNGTNTVWTMEGVVNENVTQLTSYPYQITIYRPGSCVTPVSFTGNIQVAPNPSVDKDFIQANDVTDVQL
jgi:Flp pilus assembly protein TadG